MGSKERPGNYNCHKVAQQDEPLFTLLARDPIAPVLVRAWVEMRKETKPMTEEEARKQLEALSCARSMEEWRGKR